MTAPSQSTSTERAAASALERARAGERLTLEDGIALFDADLLELGAAADDACRRRHGDGVRTFVIDRNINYTNICVSGCRFCAFWRAADAPGAYLSTPDEIIAKVAEAERLGATQLLMQGGLHPELRIEWYEDLFRRIKAAHRVHVHSLSPPEIVHIARVSSLTIEETLARLRAAGLDSLPGGGAEILCDEVRSRLSPRKATVAEWLAVMRAAHGLGMPTTATMMFGHIETRADRVRHLLRLRELQDETGGFTAFIAWTYQPGNTALGGTAVGGQEYLRTLAVSRLVLDNVANLQASWVTQGPKIGQLALTFGANDLGAVMIEENVVRAAGADYRLTRQDLIRLIEGAGYRAAQRDTYYQTLASF
jgi:cyclic dehypoxanthinyl futalosine synthase